MVPLLYPRPVCVACALSPTEPNRRPRCLVAIPCKPPFAGAVGRLLARLELWAGFLAGLRLCAGRKKARTKRAEGSRIWIKRIGNEPSQATGKCSSYSRAAGHLFSPLSMPSLRTR